MDRTRWNAEPDLADAEVAPPDRSGPDERRQASLRRPARISWPVGSLRRARLLAAGLLVLVLLLAESGTAAAQDEPAAAGPTAGQRAPGERAPGEPAPPRPTVISEEAVVTDISSGALGVTISITIVTTIAGVPDGVSIDETELPRLPTCQASPINIGSHSAVWVQEGLLAHPGHLPWSVVCDNGGFAIAWVPETADQPAVVVSQSFTVGVDPREIWRSLFDIVPLPSVEIGLNPGDGMVAIPTWLWVEGYRGGLVEGSRTLDEVRVDVQIWPLRYRWQFGDGASRVTSSPGLAYPQPSTVQHVYESSPPSGSVQVDLTIDFGARYRVNDGIWQSLDPAQRSYTREHRVQELQAVLDR